MIKGPDSEMQKIPEVTLDKGGNVRKTCPHKTISIPKRASLNLSPDLHLSHSLAPFAGISRLIKITFLVIFKLFAMVCISVQINVKQVYL